MESVNKEKLEVSKLPDDLFISMLNSRQTALDLMLVSPKNKPKEETAENANT